MKNYKFLLLNNPYRESHKPKMCVDCWNEKVFDFDQRYQEAIEIVYKRSYYGISVYRKNSGRIPPVNKKKKNISVTTDEFKLDNWEHRDYALDQLKVTCIMNGLDLIYDYEKHEYTVSIGFDSEIHWYSTAKLGTKLKK